MTTVAVTSGSLAADAFFTLDARLTDAVQGLVEVAPIDALS